jgi:Tol biopolymer transport system component
MGKLIGVMVAAAALLFASAGTANAQWKGSNGQIAFTRNSNIWLMSATGTNQHRIATNGAAPRWSPNGQRITFQRGGNIWVMSANGSNQLQVTTATSVESAPSFSPDGRWILFQSDREDPGGDIGIYKLRSTKPFGSVVTVKPRVQFEDFMLPVYAANGMFSYLLDGNNGEDFNCCQIWTIQGSVEDHLIFTYPLGKIDWGPGSKTVAYGNRDFDINTNDYSSSEIRTVNADGTHQQILTKPGVVNGYFDENPCWAPAGTWMVFDEYHQTSTGTTTGIWKMKGDGTGRIKIASNGSEPDWQPLP